MTIVLADDHNLVRAGIRGLLEQIGGVTVMGEAADGETALALIKELRPTLALLDMSMPRMSGLTVTQLARNMSPDTRVVILSMHADDIYVHNALRAGAVGYLLKDGAKEELQVMVQAATAGKLYLSPSLSQRIVDGFLSGERPGGGTSPLETLTARQREILQLIAEGRSTKEIASLLSVSVKTVETHRSQVMSRLGIRDVAGLVRFAIRVGLVSDSL